MILSELFEQLAADFSRGLFFLAFLFIMNIIFYYD